MPVKLGASLPSENEARIEIIPLIDIMFFLLAAFMLVSLSMVNLKGIRVNLPTATTSTDSNLKSPVRVSVDASGLLYLDGQLLGAHELALALNSQQHDSSELRVLVSGDREARHGDVIRALDLVRSAGIQQVAFETQAATEQP